MPDQHIRTGAACPLPAPCNDTAPSPDLANLLANIEHGAAIAELHAQLMEIVFDQRNARLRFDKVRPKLMGPLTQIGLRARAIGIPPVEANYRR